jgi:hypothetical protein
MQHTINRAEQLWKNWEAQQKELENITGLGTDNPKAVIQQKYDFLRRGLNRISVNPSPAEKLYTHVIAAVANKLQKTLYPNRGARFVHRLKARLYDKPKEIRQFLELKEKTLNGSSAVLHLKGLGNIAGGLENILDFERPKIDIPISAQINGTKSLDITLNIEKNGTEEYHLPRFTARLTDDKNPEGLDMQKVAGLMQGRAVSIYYRDQLGHHDFKWIQLDFDAKIDDGNPRLKEYTPDYDYDPEKVLMQLADELGLPSLSQKKALYDIEQGEQIAFRGYKSLNETIYLEADPGNKSILIRDKDQKSISVDALIEKELAEKENRDIIVIRMRNTDHTKEKQQTTEEARRSRPFQ